MSGTALKLAILHYAKADQEIRNAILTMVRIGAQRQEFIDLIAAVKDRVRLPPLPTHRKAKARRA